MFVSTDLPLQNLQHAASIYYGYREKYEKSVLGKLLH